MPRYEVSSDMFERVMDWLEAEPDGVSEGFEMHDIQVAVAALFYHMIAIDGVVKPEEARRLKELLKRRFKLESEQIAALAVEGEASDKHSAGLFPFTVILNRELDEKQRKRVFKQLENLAMADGTLHPLEEDMLAHVRNLLKLTDAA